MDATHILIERCAYRLRNAHKGHKLSGTARRYNITPNHRRQILGSTRGHPSCWNDKTIVLFDELINEINDGETLQDVNFELLNGTVMLVRSSQLPILVFGL
jgi:hypothetical protein